MPVDLVSLVDPAHTALVTQECQNGVIGDRSLLPALAEAARAELIPNVARLAKAARAASVPVIHCLAHRRADGKGASTNARLFAAAAKAPVVLLPGSREAEVVDAIGVEEGDVTLARLHGVGPMGGTDLDPILRNLGVRTIVGVGVSLNVGMISFALDAVNEGYQFVIPRDAVVGVPREYGEAVLENTLSLVATITTTEDVIAAWR